jgi:hypothetical protein
LWRFGCAKLAAIPVAESAHVPELAVQNPYVFDTLRDSALVRVTHWIFTASFLGLLVSGWAIILSHPHFCRASPLPIL